MLGEHDGGGQESGGTSAHNAISNNSTKVTRTK